MKWTSNAEWPREAYANGVSTDTHDTLEQALAACSRLEREGFGGDRVHFPLRTWVEEADQEAIADLGLSQNSLAMPYTLEDTEGWKPFDTVNTLRIRATVEALMVSEAEVKRLRAKLDEVTPKTGDYHEELGLAEKEAEQWKAQGDMYGWNFHRGRASGIITGDILFSGIRDEVKRLREENAGLKRNRCDNCGAATTGPCPDCGAPQCCPKCCAIDRLTTERDSLRADVERLTRERETTDQLALALDTIGHLAGTNGTTMAHIQDVASTALAAYRASKEGEKADVEYYFLRHDEIIMPGDEVFSPHDKKWIPTQNIGMRCGMISLDYRRPIRT